MSRIAGAVMATTAIAVLIGASSCSLFSEPTQQAAPPVIVNNTTQGGDGGATVGLMAFGFLALLLVGVAVAVAMRLAERNRQCAAAEKERDQLANQLVSLGHVPALGAYSYGYNARNLALPV